MFDLVAEVVHYLLNYTANLKLVHLFKIFSFDILAFRDAKVFLSDLGSSKVALKICICDAANTTFCLFSFIFDLFHILIDDVSFETNVFLRFWSTFKEILIGQKG